MAEEHRKAPRLALAERKAKDLQLRFGRSEESPLEEVPDVIVIDISNVGASLSAPRILPASTLVQIQYPLADGDSVTIRGRVLWAIPSLLSTFRHGVQFEREFIEDSEYLLAALQGRPLPARPQKAAAAPPPEPESASQRSWWRRALGGD